MKNIKETPVYIFESNERTKYFAKFCFEKLGYQNITLISEGTTFKEKYLIFAEKALSSKKTYFIRSDADCLVFEGINNLLETAVHEKYDWLTGVYFDYIMNRHRGGTPQILSKNVLEALMKDSKLMPDSNKPETHFSIAIKDSVKMGDVKTFTNLHEFEQYPSKVCNSFLNRLKRGHHYLYNNQYLNNLPTDYREAISVGFNSINKQKEKNNMNYENFFFLDKNFSKIKESDFNNLYSKYKNLYDRLKEHY